MIKQGRVVDNKQKEWMTNIIKKEVAKLFKETQLGKESSVNFIQTTYFAGIASHSKHITTVRDSWIIDIGASNHICVNHDFFL